MTRMMAKSVLMYSKPIEAKPKTFNELYHSLHTTNLLASFSSAKLPFSFDSLSFKSQVPISFSHSFFHHNFSILYLNRSPNSKRLLYDHKSHPNTMNISNRILIIFYSFKMKIRLVRKNVHGS